jgi:hypothetical protein
VLRLDEEGGDMGRSLEPLPQLLVEHLHHVVGLLLVHQPAGHVEDLAAVLLAYGKAEGWAFSGGAHVWVTVDAALVCVFRCCWQDGQMP